MQVALCLVVKNEERSISEWLKYHLALGIDKIFVYDNESTDNTAGIVKDYAADNPISLILWSDVSPRYQMNAYDHCLKNCVDFNWVGFIDSDEFISENSQGDLRRVLAMNASSSAVVFNWAIFGSSGHMTRQSGSVIAAYVRRAPDEFGPNQHVKCFVRPQSTHRSINPHFFEVDGLYSDADGRSVDWLMPGVIKPPVQFGAVKINHYFVKSKEDWSAKITRGYHDTTRTDQEFEAYDRNEVLDEGMLPHATMLNLDH